MEVTTWKSLLESRLAADAAREIDLFEGQMALRRIGKVDEKVFAETRLRWGIYGQRYDNGQRHDGQESRTLAFPTDLTKGPNTLWDAPGMQRIKLPYGRMTPAQMDVLAQVADAYSDGILHVTTRQDIQLHFVHIEDTPDLMRRLAAVGITTKEACGNAVRNVTGCPLAGVCHTEPFEISGYAQALTEFLMGHDDTQDFGRKFKIAFSGCEAEACGLVKMHDLGLLARIETVDGVATRGFTVYIGGGLGAIPHQAKILTPFIEEERLLPLSQAIARVFARHGEKRNRNQARIKFLVAKLGIDAFRDLVFEELETLPFDERWTGLVAKYRDTRDTPLRPASALADGPRPAGFEDWRRTNVYAQRQPGYSVVTVRLPLGDLTAAQLFDLADITRRFAGENARTTVDQNIVLRYIPDGDLPDVYAALTAAGLGTAGANGIVDITACPGTDTCKLGIASSRGLAGELMRRLEARWTDLPAIVQDLNIKISGCFNSCGQHHVADIGFFGNSRKVGSYKVPHFQVVLGGQWSDNAGSYGMAVGAVPARLVPDVVDAVSQRFVADREGEESFQHWVARLGKQGARGLIEPFMITPDFATQPDFFSDWGDPRVYTLNDLGIGECAGEVVSLFELEVARAESESFEAQLALERGDGADAVARAHRAMLSAARGLLRSQNVDIGDTEETIVPAFETHFVETERFFDPFAGAKFARYLTGWVAPGAGPVPIDVARQRIEEAQLFIEAAHACDMRMQTPATPVPVAPAVPRRAPVLPPRI
ncbi:MAG: nitrite/sulfite reductase [Rhodothermales bacterium]